MSEHAAAQERFGFLRSIRLQNILSYGSDAVELEARPLNVLIGPNASGKSNLIEALSLLSAAPKDLLVPIREGGGVRDWLWKGEVTSQSALVEITVSPSDGLMPLRYHLSFGEVAARFSLLDERVENEEAYSGHGEPYFFYAYQSGHPAVNVKTESEDNGGRSKRQLRREDVSPDQSILSQRRDPDTYPELTYLAKGFEQVRFYREWNFGRYTSPRLPQKADLPEDVLLEDASNLGLVLNNLQNRPDVKRELLGRLRTLYEGVDDLNIKVHGGTVQIFFHEKGLKHPVPATRLSDGTLRYLCLLAVLCHPEPPPVVCLEEPELGLHPDILPTVAKLLIEASERTQLFVTTHSDILVDALSENPEAVVVCERGPGGSRLRRLKAAELQPWLEKYRLGDLWTRGELGGTRW